MYVSIWYGCPSSSSSLLMPGVSGPTGRYSSNGGRCHCASGLFLGVRGILFPPFALLFTASLSKIKAVGAQAVVPLLQISFPFLQRGGIFFLTGTKPAK